MAREHKTDNEVLYRLRNEYMRMPSIVQHLESHAVVKSYVRAEREVESAIVRAIFHAAEDVKLRRNLLGQRKKDCVSPFGAQAICGRAEHNAWQHPLTWRCEPGCPRSNFARDGIVFQSRRKLRGEVSVEGNAIACFAFGYGQNASVDRPIAS